MKPIAIFYHRQNSIWRRLIYYDGKGALKLEFLYSDLYYRCEQLRGRKYLHVYR